MTKQEVKEIVVEIIIDKLCLFNDQVTDDAHIANDLGADSIDQVELVIDIEKAFGISILEEHWIRWETVSAVVDGVFGILNNPNN